MWIKFEWDCPVGVFVYFDKAITSKYHFKLYLSITNNSILDYNISKIQTFTPDQGAS